MVAAPLYKTDCTNDFQLFSCRSAIITRYQKKWKWQQQQKLITNLQPLLSVHSVRAQYVLCKHCRLADISTSSRTVFCRLEAAMFAVKLFTTCNRTQLEDVDVLIKCNANWCCRGSISARGGGGGWWWWFFGLESLKKQPAHVKLRKVAQWPPSSFLVSTHVYCVP